MVPGCGNGRCEFGEECRDLGCTNGCASDCPAYYSSRCPGGYDTNNAFVKCSGHGACSLYADACTCYQGYSGNNCGSCAVGYMRTRANGPCVFLAGALSSCKDGVKNGNELGVDCGGPNCPACRNPVTSSNLAIIVIGGLCAAVAVGVLAVVGFRMYTRGKVGRVDVVVSAVSAAAAGGAVGGNGRLVGTAASGRSAHQLKAGTPIVRTPKAANVTLVKESSKGPSSSVFPITLDSPQPSVPVLDWTSHETRKASPHPRTLAPAGSAMGMSMGTGSFRKQELVRNASRAPNSWIE